MPLPGFASRRRDAALVRLDETLPGRPIQALMDTQAIGHKDDASLAVWRAHQTRMADARGARQSGAGLICVLRAVIPMHCAMWRWWPLPSR